MESSGHHSDQVQAAARLLGIKGAITLAAVKVAYRRAMQKWHPDLHLGKDTMKLAEWNSRRINEARDVLVCLPAGLPVEAPVAPVKPRQSKSRRHFGTKSRESFEDPAAVVHLIDSKEFLAAGYSELGKTLFLRFRSGVTYRYEKVPKSLVSRFLRARGKYTFATRNIFFSFTYYRCS